MPLESLGLTLSTAAAPRRGHKTPRSSGLPTSRSVIQLDMISGKMGSAASPPVTAAVRIAFTD